MTDNEKLAALLFPDVHLTPQQCEEQYPARQLPEGARVTRFAPSPTGYLHIGGLFAAMTARLTAQATNGVFFLRIEDTDKKREIADGVSAIVSGLDAFGITPDEGITGLESECGAYGPYQQSRRRALYHCFAKELVCQGFAYPCFCTEEDLTALREKQEAQSVNKGYYGAWAACRSLPLAEQKQDVAAGRPYTLRLRSPGDESRRITFDDLIKGKIEMPENTQDIVLLKTDGIPTYHFAHAVDDHLMRTTHVVRGDEWVASVPVHIQLFQCCGFRPVKYAHIAPIMKEENGGKRKLSKRKDPEAAVSYYTEQGYPKESVTEYLLTLANSNYEDWRRANRDAPQSAFPFNLKKMSASGALFDLQKLNDVSKNVISLMTADDMYEKAVEWAGQYDKALCELLAADQAFATGIFRIDRGIAKPRKDIAKWSDVRGFVSYFYDALYQPDYSLPENLTPAAAAEILRAYLAVYRDADDKDAWFARIKELCAPLGYTPNVKEYKKDPQAFKGHVGDISAVIRIAVTSRRSTPDLHAIMQLLGEEKVSSRMNAALNYYEEA